MASDKGDSGAGLGMEKLFRCGNGGIAGWLLDHEVAAKVEAVPFPTDVINMSEAAARVQNMEAKQRILAQARDMGGNILLDAR